MPRRKKKEITWTLPLGRARSVKGQANTTTIKAGRVNDFKEGKAGGFSSSFFCGGVESYGCHMQAR